MIPPPVDLNKLKGILGNAKSIMNKVETGDFQTGNVDPRALTEDGVMELQAEGVRRPMTQQQQQFHEDYDYEQAVSNSKMPEAVKKLMLEKRIPPATMTNSFSLSDVSELSDEKPFRPRTPNTTPKKAIRENYQQSSDMITISKAELKEMVNSLVNERLLEFMTKTNNKAITEEAVKKTISLLIKEGKLPQKKKTI